MGFQTLAPTPRLLSAHSPQGPSIWELCGRPALSGRCSCLSAAPFSPEEPICFLEWGLSPFSSGVCPPATSLGLGCVPGRQPLSELPQELGCVLVSHQPYHSQESCSGVCWFSF